MGRPFQIAIDGPVAAGKSTLAKLLAKKLSLTYIDTGAMYRALALKAQREHIGWTDERSLAELAHTLKIRLARPVGERNDGRTVTVYLDGEDVSWEIRTSEIGEGASQVSQYQGVRRELVALQQAMANDQDVVMEGRDIGLVVLPQAQLKVFLTADTEVRARRKYDSLKERGGEQSLEEVKKALMKRDNREMTREVTPLVPAKDAWHLDTSNYTLNEVVELICGKLEEKGLRKC